MTSHPLHWCISGFRVIWGLSIIHSWSKDIHIARNWYCGVSKGGKELSEYHIYTSEIKMLNIYMSLFIIYVLANFCLSKRFKTYTRMLLGIIGWYHRFSKQVLQPVTCSHLMVHLYDICGIFYRLLQNVRYFTHSLLVQLVNSLIQPVHL